MRKKGPSRKPKKKRGRVLTLAELYHRQGGRCKYCFAPMDLGGDGLMRATRDHIKPKARGGKQAGNLVAACARCNEAKADAPVQEFVRSLNAGS